ncbi:MAG: peptidase C39 family protein [Caldilineaceae bacterium]
MPAPFLEIEHVQQHNDGECLAACAAIVLNFIGLRTAYKRLLRILEIKDNFGTPSSKIRNLEQLGIRVVYQQGNIEALRKHLLAGQPCIAFVRTGELPYWKRNLDHAIVVAGIDAHVVYLNDPDLPTAPVQVSLGDFDLAWLEHDEMYAVLTA